MQTHSRRLKEILYGLFLLIHPLPVAMHILAVTLFALVAAWPQFNWPVLLLLIGAHAAMQMAIAVTNDYCDRKADAHSQKVKPIPLGMIRPLEALVLGIALMVLMVLLLLPLNGLALLVSLLYLAFGMSYNLGLKSTPYSGLVFAFMFPLIPVYAFVGVGRTGAFLGWFVAVAALLGIAINIANSLPDYEDDLASNLRTLAVSLGVRGSYIICTVCILLSGALIGFVTLTRLVPAQQLVILPLLFIICPVATVAYVYFRNAQARNLRKSYFYLVVFASIFLATGWIIGVRL